MPRQPISSASQPPAIRPAAVAAAAALTAFVHAPASAAADAVTANYRTSATGATTDQVKPWFTITNTGTTTIPLHNAVMSMHWPVQNVEFVAKRLLHGDDPRSGQPVLLGSPIYVALVD